jgi:hypothetical protein
VLAEHGSLCTPVHKTRAYAMPSFRQIRALAVRGPSVGLPVGQTSRTQIAPFGAAPGGHHSDWVAGHMAALRDGSGTAITGRSPSSGWADSACQQVPIPPAA